MRSLRNICYVLLISFSLIGCDSKPKVKLSQNANEMATILEKVDKEDCKVLYDLFSGMSVYNSKYQGLTKNHQAFDLFKIVKQRYGKEDKWLDGPLEMDDPNDLIQKKLLELKMDDPQEFTEESRIQFVKLFEEFAEGALHSYKSKVK